MTNKNTINRNSDANDLPGGNPVPKTGTALALPKHDFGLNPKFEGKYQGVHDDGSYIFKTDNGLVCVKPYETIRKALTGIPSDTIIQFEYVGDGEFYVYAPEL